MLSLLTRGLLQRVSMPAASSTKGSALELVREVSTKTNKTSKLKGKLKAKQKKRRARVAN